MDFTTGVLVGALIWAVAVLVFATVWHLNATRRERRAKLETLEAGNGESPFSLDLERRRARADSAMRRYGRTGS